MGKIINNINTIDGLPEEIHYLDSGCNYNQSCLNCSLAVCVYDDPEWVRRYVKTNRNNQMLVDRTKGMTIKAIANKYQVSARTVNRALKTEYHTQKYEKNFFDLGVIYKKLLS